MPEEIEITPEGEAIGFWTWVMKNKIPLCITEGVKKTGALLSAGFVGIALPGIYGGYRRLQDERWNLGDSRRLIPELEIFNNHQIYFVFDNDEKEKTIRAVNTAIEQTGKLLKRQKCKIKVVNWQEPEKGVDDFIVANGVEAFEKYYTSALPLNQWIVRALSELTYPVNVALNQKYLGKLNIPSDAKLIGIKSPKGSGKTESLANFLVEAARRGERVLILTHRVQLGMELCRRFGLPYVTEIKDCETGELLGFGLCVDSLHPKSQARFKAEDWIGDTIVVDECEQVFWHMLNSSTCQRERVAILQEFKALIINTLTCESGRVILSDADLSNLSVDYIRSLAGVNLDPWIIVNDFKDTEEFEEWQVYNYPQSTPAAMIAELEQHLEEGGKPFICCSAQRATSCYGTRNLEAHFSKKFPHLKGLRIDSESIADPNHPAFCCTTDLNNVLPQYDYVLASPSIETGVSIDIKGHFTSAWAILQGVSPENSARQALARVREPVDRHIWAAPHGLGKIGNGSISINSLLASQHKLAKANIQLLKDADFDYSDLDTNFDVVSLRTWAKFAVRVNGGMGDYRSSVLAGLKAEGHQISSAGGGDGEKAKAELDETRQAKHQEEALAIANAPDISKDEFDKLKEKRSKKEEERQKERKHSLKLRYGTDVTPDLVIKDDDGWHPKLTMHYYVTVGKEYLPARDKKRLDTIKEQGEGKAWIPDLNKSLLSAPVRALSLERLGILRLLDTQRQFKNEDEDLQEIAKNAIQYRWNIKSALGISINEIDSPITIAQKLLGKLGLRLTFLYKEGSRGEQQRVYGFKDPADGRDEIFAAWLARDEAVRQAELENVSNCDTVVTPGNKEYRDIPDDYQNTSPSTNRGDEPQNVSNCDTVVTAGNKDYINNSSDYQNTSQSIDEVDTGGLSQEDVVGFAEFLENANCAELATAAFGMLRDLCQQAKQAIWAKIPCEKRAELWHWKTAAAG
nr:plasmid replication protein, CyRepA1 family [Trichocoleus sp. FACHB-90]